MNYISCEEEFNKLKKGEKYSYICRNCGKEVIGACKRSKKYREKQLLFLCRSCAIRYGVKEKYGVDNVFQLNEIKEKSKQTCLEYFGTENYKQSEIGKSEFIKYSLNRYGVENPFQSEEIKEKSKQTCLKKYGVPNAMKSNIILSRFKQSMLSKYNKEHALQVFNFLNKFKSTNLKKYNTPYPVSNKYFYDNQHFDSSWELYFYIYCKEQNLNIERNPKELYYFCNGRETVYQPDFLVENQLVEIKGDYFFVNDKLINPYDRSLDYKAEAKQKCMIENNVIILKSKEIKKYMDYVNNKYGKDYINQFKEAKCQTIEK